MLKILLFNKKMQEITLGEDRSTIQKNSRDKLSRLKIFEQFAGFAKRMNL